MDLGLKNKVIMVAAASKGLGYGIARALAEEGAHVSIASRTLLDIEAAAESLRNETGSEVMGAAFDATDPSSILNWTKTTRDRFGGIDGLVVNAGGPSVGSFDDFKDDDWIHAFELTLLSSVRMIRAVLPHMRERGKGAILTMTSSSVKEPIHHKRKYWEFSCYPLRYQSRKSKKTRPVEHYYRRNRPARL